MIYVFLIIITLLVYSIYKRQHPITVTPVQMRESLLKEIERQEILVEGNLNTSHLTDFLTMEKALFECGSKNFLRLKERFKHDEQKTLQIFNDWYDYLKTIAEMVFESEMLDLSPSNDDAALHYKARDLIFIKIQEAEKRYKEQLGEEYVDPRKDI